MRAAFRCKKYFLHPPKSTWSFKRRKGRACARRWHAHKVVYARIPNGINRNQSQGSKVRGGTHSLTHSLTRRPAHGGAHYFFFSHVSPLFFFFFSFASIRGAAAATAATQAVPKTLEAEARRAGVTDAFELAQRDVVMNAPYQGRQAIHGRWLDVCTEAAVRAWNQCTFSVQRSALVATEADAKRALTTLQKTRSDAMADFPWRTLYGLA